jgi:16S rRNA (guanine527-N7)-methyltransferase
MSITHIQKQLENALKHAISEKHTKLLVTHLNFVIEQNKKINLTSIDSIAQGIILHIEDSLTALSEIEVAPEGLLVDLGSGAGFPGIPLAIVSGRNTTLVEATKKKAHTLEEFIRKEGLESQISVVALRAEELAREKTEHFMVATARALSSLPSLMELASPLLRIGGILVVYKGDISEGELEQAYSLKGALGMTVAKMRSFTLSDGQSKRSIILMEKTSQAKKQLPRRNGQAQRHPFNLL